MNPKQDERTNNIILVLVMAFGFPVFMPASTQPVLLSQAKQQPASDHQAQDIPGGFFVSHSITQPLHFESNVSANNFLLSLTPDPSVTWNTFLGSKGDEEGHAIAIDGTGNIFLAGPSAGAWGNPINAYTGGDDIYVAKLDAAGKLLWNTFLGAASSEDVATGVSTDGIGNVYITGYSYTSWGSPVNPFSGSRDAFTAMLNGTGVLQWNTFLGSVQGDYSRGIIVDGNRNVYVTGFSNASWGKPVQPYAGGVDAFVLKLDKNGTRVWNTFMGSPGPDHARGIALDGSGNLYIVGESSAGWGNPKNNHAGGLDAFVGKLNNTGVLQWNTFMGSAGEEEGHAITVDGSRNIYIVGRSNTTWGVPLNGYLDSYDIFAARLDGNGNRQWNTFLGAIGDDYGRGIALDSNGNPYITGMSPASWGTPVNAYSGGRDAFAARLNTSGICQWNSFLGSSESKDYGYGIVLDGNGSVYISGNSSANWGNPVNGHTGAIDAFAAKIKITPPYMRGNAGISGATMSYTGGIPVTAAGDGNYSIMVPYGWSGMVTPSKTGMVFTPSYRNYTRLVSNQTGQDFTAKSMQRFNSIAAQDGWVLESTETSGLGGSKDASASTFFLGDDAGNREYRTILSFDTASLPDSAVISKVTLKIRFQGLVGTNPFTSHGSILVDIRKGYFSTLADLQTGDFQAFSSKLAAGTIKNVSSGGWFSVDFGSSAFIYINLSGLTQVRLRFSLDDNNDQGADYLKFYSGDYLTSSLQPQLIITYTVP